MVGRAHHHGVDLRLHGVEHFAEILERPGLGIAFERAAGVAPVDVGQGNDVLAAAGHAVNISPAHPAHADPRYV